eukprot:scaffold1320_cov253-Pinguiococcus_pyrenoidosus.AAC.4
MSTRRSAARRPAEAVEGACAKTVQAERNFAVRATSSRRAFLVCWPPTSPACSWTRGSTTATRFGARADHAKRTDRIRVKDAMMCPFSACRELPPRPPVCALPSV